MDKIKIAALIYILHFPVYGIEIDPEGAAVKRGLQEYQEGKFSEALDEYESIQKEDPRLDFNKGTAWYKQGNYEEAIRSFKKSLDQAKEKELIEKNLYNLGNSYYRAGDTRESARHYAETLKQNPEHEQARKNLEIIKKIRNQQKQNQQKNDPQDNQDKKDGNNRENPGESGQNDKKGEKRGDSTREEIKKMLESGEHERIKRKKNRPEYGKESRIFW